MTIALERGRARLTGDLTMAGEALFGPRWKRDLAHELSVGDRTMRRWATGERTPPPDVMRKLLDTIARRRADLAHLGDRLRWAPGDAGDGQCGTHDLRKAGRTLFGPRWQSDLARELGVWDRTVRLWVAGQAPPPGIGPKLCDLVIRRRAALAQAGDRLREALDGA